MAERPRTRELYHAQGLAVGGYIVRPKPEPIRSRGAASIPVTGGSQTARARKFNHRDIVWFEKSETIVSGGKSSDGSRLETLATCIIEGLNIQGVVTAERIVARLSGAHPDQDNTEPTFTAAGSYFQGLRINGLEVQCRCLADRVGELGVYSTFRSRAADREELTGQVIRGGGWEEKGFLPISLCADLRVGDQECETGDNHIYVPGFGTIYLAELIISHHKPRLTMLRAELGSPVEGKMALASIEGGPTRMP